MDNKLGHQAPLEPDDAPELQTRWSVRPGLAALFGFLVTFVFLYGTLVIESQLRERSLREDAQVLLDVLSSRTRERIDAYFGALRLLREEAGAVNPNGAGHFRRRANALIEQFNAYQAVTSLSPDGVIVQVVPLEGNESALGLDVSSVPGAANALAYARESGELGVTGPIELAQGGLGFVGYLPAGSPPGEHGFISAVFRAGEFIEPLIGDRLHSGYAVQVSDQGRPVYRYGDMQPDAPMFSNRIRVGQRTWDFSLGQSASAGSPGLGLSVLQALVIAVIAALLMAAVSYRLARGATAELRSRAEAWRIAHTSSLTGLPNRYALLKALEVRAESGRPYALLLIDLLQFRLINAIHGQAVADKVIQWVAARLAADCREHEIHHLGGAEFAVLADNVDVRGARELAARLQELANQHVELEDIELDIDGEVGFTYVNRSVEGGEPLSRAGAALVRAKEEGGPQAYDESIREEAQSRSFMESELRFALQRRQLQLYFQPICRLDTENPETHGFEVLMRWNHPELGFIRPDVFIPIAESSGIIDELGRWVLREACKQIARWHEQGLDYHVGVNLSPRQMLDRGLSSDIEQALAETGAPAELLVIEITESLAIRNLDSAVQLLTSLRETGVGIALDDFGTGYSSLSYLNLLPITILKLDRVLIARIDRDKQPLEIARGMIALSHAIGLEVVAEGVETREQLVLLQSLGCDYAQGYYFNKPLPVDEIMRRINAA